MITWAQVVAFAAELSGVDVVAQNAILAFVNDAVSGPAWADESRRTLARIYQAAHLGTSALPSDTTTGAVVSGKSLGDASISYAVAAPSSGAEWATTSYGRLYLMLVRSNPLARAPLCL